MTPPTDDRLPPLKPVTVGWRSRALTWILRGILRPWLAWVARGPLERLARTQLMIASRRCRDPSGLALQYRLVGQAPRAVPGHVLGEISDTAKAVILYVHGGAFVLPAAPEQHVRFVGKLCRTLDAVGFVVDYRLAPINRFPAPLDDCERAYRALLDLGFDPARLVLAGESAGGTLILGLLQRIRRNGWPMPACAVTISPATDLSRLHGLPSRTARMRRDPILALATLARLVAQYVGDHDTADPELSPLYADLRGFPPLYLIASDNEVLRDDAVLFAERARAAGVDTRLDLWPVLPHAFPVLEFLFPEAAEARADIVAFVREQLP